MLEVFTCSNGHFRAVITDDIVHKVSEELLEARRQRFNNMLHTTDTEVVRVETNNRNNEHVITIKMKGIYN